MYVYMQYICILVQSCMSVLDCVYGAFQRWRYPIAGWFIREIFTNMDETVGVPQFQEDPHMCIFHVSMFNTVQVKKK